MYRKSIDYIVDWFNRKTRKPLIIRGARQVGKTTAVLLAAERLEVELIAINMEDAHAFMSELPNNDPLAIFDLIALGQGKRVLNPDKTLFFFDEAQEQPAIIPFLRYCHERAPQYRVILTGSLLEFVINAPDFSFPVGRVEFLFMGPMGFDEYLRGVGQQPLADKLHELSPTNPPSSALHQLLSTQVRTFFVVGGMPEAVKVYRDSGSWLEVARVKESILETYHADFGKYHKMLRQDVLQQVFRKLPYLVSQKTIYSHLAEGVRVETSRKALDALELARVVSRCFHVAGNGVPLAAEMKDTHFKTFFLDVGLALSALGLNIDAIGSDLNAVARGAVAEQFIAQHLLDDRELFQKPQLFYWDRQEQGTRSEIDFLAAYQGQVIPIEVKSGTAGSMKSLQVFMRLKQDKPPVAIRFLGNLPETQDVSMADVGHSYRLVSLPHYLVEHWRRFVG